MKNIIFFGAGNISQAIIIGLIKSGMSKDNILYIDRNAKNKKVLLKMGIKPINIKNIDSKKDILVLAVKPKDTLSACAEICNIEDSPKIISVVAGIKINKISSSFKNSHVVRAMPITASAYGKGITAIYGKPSAKNLVSFTNKIFKKVGTSIILEKEIEIDNFTGLIGSGPAYFFHLLKVYEKRVLKLCKGNKKLTNEIISNFLDGISASIREGVELDDAINKIASKKGTTEAGINSLKSNNVLQLFEKGIVNAIKRSKEISNEY
tara:strand:- start:1623 stop:2417 length:795 start_codon:yes stop_codon:yes gene_type:complete